MSAAFRPVGPDALRDAVVAACRRTPARPGARALRVGVDGADASRPGALADAVAAVLRAGGTPALRVQAEDFLRPASLRLEHGRTDELSYRTAWFDHEALAREVLDPVGAGGSGEVLPALRDPRTDRSVRAARVPAPAGAVLLLDGPLLAGSPVLALDLLVHLHLSPAALARGTAAEDAWTVPALLAHETAVGTDELADLLVRVDHPERAALLDRTPP